MIPISIFFSTSKSTRAYIVLSFVYSLKWQINLINLKTVSLFLKNECMYVFNWKIKWRNLIYLENPRYFLLTVCNMVVWVRNTEGRLSASLCVGVWVCGCTLELRNHAADFNQTYRNGFSKGLDLCVWLLGNSRTWWRHVGHIWSIQV